MSDITGEGRIVLCISHENDDTNDGLYMNIAFTEGLEKNIMTL